MILCVDPGVHGCGCALFEMSILQCAGYVRGDFPTTASRVREGVGGGVDGLVLEVPRVYPGPRANDPNDLIDLALVDGLIAGEFTVPLKTYYPSDWKGQVPKKIMTERIKKTLDEVELLRVDRIGALDHNTFDAVGIGLHYLGRLNKGK